MHATKFLKNPGDATIGPVAVLFGPERHLKLAALGALREIVLGEEGDLGLARFTGRDTDLKNVADELRTISMWGDRRLVVVDEADDFVSKHRVGLEKYLQHPAQKSVLVLDVKSWPKNTRLAKAVAKIGLDIECKALSGRELSSWLSETCGEQYEKQITRDALALMIELAGVDLGLLDTELSKLVAYVGDRKRIDADDVRALVGGWKAETTWTMLAAVRDGHIATALTCLDKLLVAGEAPQKVLGGISFVFRRVAQATEFSRQGIPLHAALQRAGVFPRDVGPTETYLRRIGRGRAEKIYRLLLTADGDLKGSSRAPLRVQLERLLIELSGRCA